jgi:hypothetical protein
VFAVVEHQQALAVSDRVQQALLARDAGLFGYADRISDGMDDHRGIGHLHEIDEHHTVVEALDEIVGDRERQARLADAARTGRGDETIVAHRRGERGELCDPPDEGRQRRR